MARIHMVLQGTAGIGQSLVAATLAQYKARKGLQPLCIDTDSLNATFQGYKALDVRRQDTRHCFDALLETIASARNDVVIDHGTSAFPPGVHDLIGPHELVVHTLVAGGPALADSLSSFAQLASQLPAECLFMVWLDPCGGPIEQEGKGFEQLKAYTAHRHQVSAIVQLPALNADTSGRDFAQMLQQRRTFDEALADPALTIVTRQRLKSVKTQLFAQLDNAAVV